MARLDPVSLRLLRPELTGEVPSPPHDALTVEDRRRHLAAHPRSYLGVTRAPEDLEDSEARATGREDAGEAAVEAGRRHLDRLLADGVFGPPSDPGFLAYRLEQDGHRQTGLVCGVATADYDDGVVRIHEGINPERARQLARHLETVGAQSSPIVLAQDGLGSMSAAIESATAGPALLDFTDGEGLRQRLWPVPVEAVDGIRAEAAAAPLYLIDGHHRAAAASLVRAAGGSGTAAGAAGGGGAASLMLAAVFPVAEMRNQAFHRVVTGVDADDLAARLSAAFPTREEANPAAVVDRRPDELAVRLGRRPAWLVFRVPFETADGAGLADIDPLRFADRVLGPLLGIDESDPDGRLGYRPGAADWAAVAALEPEPTQAVFLMRPVPLGVLMAAADAGRTMPPKSTYFVPKVRSGLFVRMGPDPVA